MHIATLFALLISTVPCLCQRSFYAGLHAIGIPEVKPSPQTDNKLPNELPAPLKGDLEAANRIDKLPEDQRPIWYLNQQHYKEQLDNPKSYPQRPSIFNENSG